MNILIGSKNPAKIKAVKDAFETLKISDVEVISVDAKSNVPSKPIGFEILRGCENRNKDVKQYAESNSIKYDYICSIEGGFAVDENGLPFVVTYAIVEDANGKKSTGKSLGIRLNREMYRYIREDGSLNSIIGEINHNKNNKQSQGIMGFLTDGILDRAKVDQEAVISALVPLIFSAKYDLVTSKIEQFSSTKCDPK